MTAALLLVLLVPAGAAPAPAGTAARSAQAEHLRGTLLERSGAYAQALEAYENALALDPSSAFITGEAAELALELEDGAKAERWARRRLALAPNDAKSHMILGRVLWARGDAAGAEAEFQRAMTDDPASLDTLLALTELIAGRDPPRARRFLEEFLARRPEQAARVLFELGRLDAQEEKYRDAEAKLKRAIELDDSESAPALLALAQVYEITRATAAALAEYRALLADEPEDVELRAHVGELEAAAGETARARETFRLIKQKRPDDPAASAWLAADAERSGDFAAAAAALKGSAALKDDPTQTLRLGYYQIQSGGLSDAMATLERARRRWPKDDRVAYYLALGHDDRGERAEAVELLREVLAQKPDDRDARWQLATVLEKMNRIADAETEFRRLIGDKPDDAPALNYLGYALADRGLKLPEAERLVRRALEIEPSNPAYRDSLGWALFRLGRSTEAARELERSALALPGDETVWEHLGRAREAVGRDEDAWRAWRRAQGLGSASAGARADALQRRWSAEKAGEMWRELLEREHGGVERYDGVCDVTGRVAGRALSESALLSFRAPKELTLEVLGPLFEPVARARVDARGFAMDRFAVPGLADEQVRGAAEGALDALVAVLGGEPFRPGPARLRRRWWRRELDRPGWRVALDARARARAVTPDGGGAVTMSDFEEVGARRIPRAFAARGPFWEVSVTCAQPKIEAAPAGRE